MAELRRQYEPVFWPLFVPEAKEMFRWRVRLECGCSHEVYTLGEDKYPGDHTYPDVISQCRLPFGEFWCETEDGPVAKPYRDIVRWVESHGAPG